MLLLRLLFVFGGAHGLCLDDGIPEQDRRYLDGMDGSLKFTITEFAMQMAVPTGINSDAVMILAEEKMGVHTKFSPALMPTSNVAVRTMGGCSVTDQANQCDLLGEGYAGENGHMFLGAWKSYAPAIHELQDDELPEMRWIGSYGFDGMFVKESHVMRASADKIDLMWIRNYNIPAQPARSYFGDTVSSIGATPLDCSEVRYLQPEDPTFVTYAEVTGDTDGHAASCVDNWWLSPLCRDNSADCIPLLTGGDGWSVNKFAQYAHFFEIPLAIGTMSWGDYVSFGRTTDAMLYWWFPDLTFASDLPTAVLAPGRNPTEQAAGIWKTANEKDELVMFKWQGMEALDLTMNLFVDSIELNDYDILASVELLRANDPNRHYAAGGGGDAAFLPERMEAACTWVKENEAVWSSWLPDKTECRDGEGVLTVGSNSFCQKCPEDTVSVIGPDGKRLCGDCQAGEYDEDGKCTPCHRGTFNAVEGATACEACPPGTFGSVAGATSIATCLPCAAGTYAMQEGTAVCPTCPAGTFSDAPDSGDIGMAECSPCASGTYSIAQADGMQECVDCPAGHFCGEGAPAPVPCEIGLFAEAGAEACVRCPARTYQDVEGQEGCKACPPDFMSPPGSTVPADCVCAQGSFYAASKGQCVDCIEGMVCPQGLGIPFVAAGLYAEAKYAAFEGRYTLDDGEWVYSKTEPADVKDEYFEEVLVWNCPYGETACPGRSIDAGNGFVVENARKINECEGDLFMNGCSRCPHGYFFSRDEASCSECTGGDSALFPVLYCIGLGVMVFLYKITKYKASQKLTNMLMFSCSASLMLNFFQMLGVIGFYAAEFPAFLQGFFDFFKLFVFDLDVLRASCATGSDFHARFLTRTVSPLIFMLSFLALHPLSVALSKVVPKVEAMDGLNVLNAAGLITNAGYIALCKISMQYYECAPQPSAPATVAAYPDIDCSSTEHSSMMPLAVFFTLLYGVSIYFMCLYLCYVAPKRMIESRDFRRKTRFLVGRWNPGRWYWGPVLQTRNLFVSLVAVFYPSDGVMQFLVTGALVVIYTIAQSMMEPWRDLFLNITDSVLGLSITLTCMFGILLVKDTGEDEVRISNAKGYLTAVFTISFIALAYAIAQAIAALVYPKRTQTRDAKYTREAVKILLLQTKKISQLCQQGAMEGDLEEALASYLTYSEQRQIFKIGKVILHELCGVTYKSQIEFKRLMINATPSDPINLDAVNMELMLGDDGDEIDMQKASRVSAMSKVGGTFR